MFNVIEENLNTASLEFVSIGSTQLQKLKELEQESFDVAIVFTDVDEQNSIHPFKFNPVIHQPFVDKYNRILDEISALVTKTGTLYIYGLPQWLPYFSVHLSQKQWQFKYWIGLETYHPLFENSPIVDTHEGILLYVRDKKKFSLRKVRSPHIKCDVCGDFTADWGGKKALRNPLGYAISDVWDDLPSVSNKTHVLSKEVWQRLILLTANDNARILCVNYDGENDFDTFIFG